MIIEKVTITGADDKVNPDELISISKKYPFVEWGILFSNKRIGTERYPSHEWINTLYQKQKELSNMGYVNCSAHLCGDYAVEIISEGVKDKYFDIITKYTWLFNRWQLNFNCYKNTVNYDELLHFVKDLASHTILQYNNSNYEICKRIISDCKDLEYKLHFLYDGSGGRGVLPDNWKKVVPNHFTGYAGGLNPDNLGQALININEAAGNNAIWIDTETGVRTNNEFDLNKVVQFLEIASKWE